MKKTLAVILAVVMILALGAVAFADDAAEAEWDTSVPTEVTEEVRAAFEQATEGLLGVSYEPVAVLGQQGDTCCILCKATVVYPGAKPYNALVYVSVADGRAEVLDICELRIDMSPAVEVEIDYGSSELFTEEEMDAAIALIWEEFDSWEGCELHRLSYAGDACCNEENIDWMNSLRDGQGFTQCIEFVSEFHSPTEGGGAWEPDTEYTGWQWWLARTDGGEWELLTWGY